MAAIVRTERRTQILGFIAFVAAVVAVAALGSAVTDVGMDGWYASLAKPSWQPPSWAFGVAWTVLYGAIAVAGWLWWRAERTTSTIVVWWAIQLGLNLGWTLVFFGLERPGWALLTIVALDATIVICILVGWEIRRAASLLFLPYLAWTAFATALNLAIVRLN